MIWPGDTSDASDFAARIFSAIVWVMVGFRLWALGSRPQLTAESLS